ncbi:MAG: SUMF1/EgtB/PvdO family nonheme iron enzyme [Deltaproteobacteria bacterium]|nr:SUMF1/EgtB/PvdO family nonheme iron enzyme [Deltaproteobacteria bacterium]
MRAFTLVMALVFAAACGMDQAGVPGTVTVGAATGGLGGASGVGGAAGGTGGASDRESGAGSTPLPCEVDGVVGECIDVEGCVGDRAPVVGYCPGPASVQCCLPYAACIPGAAVVPTPSLVEAPGTGGCPDGMLPVEDFCVDRYEAALVRVSDGAPWSPYFNPGVVAVRAVSVKGVVPQGYIDQVRAEEACLAAGKRLCTDDEWLRACRGASKRVYPYGDALVLGRCNDHRAQHPAVEYFGTTDSWIYSEIDHECLNQLPDSLALAGSHPDCVTEDGAFDMMGNLHEWTAASAGTFRGGFYVDTVKNGPGCLYATTAHDVTHWDYSTGFRCCYGP